MTTSWTLGDDSGGETSTLPCPKCGHENPEHAGTCQLCARHLHVYCAHCGHLNFRGNKRCEECRTQLHLPWPERWKRAKARTWIKPVELVLFVAAVAVAYKGIIGLAEFEFPKVQSTPPPNIVVLRPDGTWRKE